MIVKCFILRTDFKLELGKAQSVQILLNFKNELPTTSSIEDAKSILGQDLELGKIFYENGGVQAIFVNLPDETMKALSNDWKLVSFNELNRENCIDYDIIVDGVEKAGYLLDNAE